MRLLSDLINLFFPKVCCACGKSLVENEDIICFRCRADLPKVAYAFPDNNELKNRFSGKVKIEYALSILHFYKSGVTQRLLHEYKYKNKPEIGEIFGRQIGAILNENDLSGEIDLIIPVPLHPKKQRKRGYNQSHYFAKGISEISGIQVDYKNLIRIKHSESQTGKTREIRWKSVYDAFEIKNKTDFKSKHILIVDDIITTGATIEACATKLTESGTDKVSVATLAIAK
jgi:ComF family protein